MTPLPNPNRTTLAWFVAMLVSLILLTGATRYYTPAPKSMLVNPLTPLSKNSVPTETLTGGVGSHGSQQTPVAAVVTFAPFLNIVPDEDGTALFISAGSAEVGGTVFANITDIGGGHNKGGTMTYSNTVQAYVTTVEGFAPGSLEGNISMTTTLGLDTGAVDFNRAHVLPSTTDDIIVDELHLTIVSTNTLSNETYIVAARSYAPPGPPPLGHRLVGSAYSVRASGALIATNKPMVLRLHYDESTLIGADPHTLAIFAWDAFNKRWDKLGGRLFYDQKYLSVATSHFTTYALMTTPAWQDEFDDFSGLNFPTEVSTVTVGGALVLSSKPGNGFAISKPITPLTAITSWGSLTFTHTITPPTTTLTVDVLSLDNNVILSNVSSGTSLASLDPAQYPALKLRANLTSTTAGQTPALDYWQLTWQAKEYKTYLPVVLK